MIDYLIPLLMLAVFLGSLPAWLWSVKRQVHQHHKHREKIRLNAQAIKTVHRPHTPAGGMPVTR